MCKTAILVLGAGESKRLGKPKQLLPYKNTTLLGHTLDQLKDIPNSHVFVVVGAHFKEVFNELRNKPVTVIMNNDWSKGMGSSLSKGASFIQKKGGYNQILVTLCDLPLINQQQYTEFIESYENENKRILLTDYDDHSGVPAIFCKSLINELSQLDSDLGAKPVIQKYQKEVLKISSKTPYFDVDTQDAYQELLSLS